MQRIAVTGATGYIGGRLVPRLLEAENRLPDISNKVGSEYMPRCSSYQAFAEVVKPLGLTVLQKSTTRINVLPLSTDGPKGP